MVFVLTIWLIATPEALKLAETYLGKLESSGGKGFPIVDSDTGIKVGSSWGAITLEGEETPIPYNCRAEKFGYT